MPKHQNKVICPWCGHKHRTDIGDFDPDADGDVTECFDCEKPFSVTAEVTIEWTTERIEI